MIRLAFLIRSLDAGGAERQLVQLCRRLSKSVFEITVITYYPGGALAPELEATPGVRVVTVGKRGRGDVVGFVRRLIRIVRESRPQIIHGYMWGANELAWMLGRITGARVVWGLRASDMDFSHYDLAFSLMARTGAWLSRRADLIIANSEAGRLHHIELGYAPARMIVIPNGIEVDRFKPDARARMLLREEWGFADDTFVVGIVGRLDPMKDHETFLEAASLAASRVPSARFVVAGSGQAAFRKRLEEIAIRKSVQDRVLWLGARRDIAAVYTALDVAVSSSAFGEGFSNALGEAMATEVPCVATNVGDAATILGDCGMIVPRRRPDLLAAALVHLASIDRAALGHEARKRIARYFSDTALAERTSAALCNLMARPGA